MIAGAYVSYPVVDATGFGLKLDVQKRPFPVFVLGHIVEKPTEN